MIFQLRTHFIRALSVLLFLSSTSLTHLNCSYLSGEEIKTSRNKNLHHIKSSIVKICVGNETQTSNLNIATLFWVTWCLKAHLILMSLLGKHPEQVALLGWIWLMKCEMCNPSFLAASYKSFFEILLGVWPSVRI